MNIAGKTALVTGAGSGIGRATVLALAAKGAARIYLVDRDAVSVEALARELGACEGLPRALDVQDTEKLHAVFDEAAAAGGLDIVLNNAGMVVGKQLFPNTSRAKLDAIIAVNVTAVILGTQWAIEQMRKKGGGVVVNTGSTAAFHTGYADYLYSATKAAVVSFSSACAAQHPITGVRVNSVLPGLVNTPILLTTGDGELADFMGPVLANNVALEPEDIAEGVIGLIEDDARVGEMLVVSAADPAKARFDDSRIRIWDLKRPPSG
ncbi:MAG: SDR family oxidoreductase [Hyphomonadaceae bacterium]|nr:SDR family oxidoreductase [Hyphomonadaceae bacterium]